MKDRRHRDEGAVMVFVAIMMVVLIAIGALVIDIGRLYVEKRELQNGADAAALAVAWDCAGGVCDTAQQTADYFADANAKAKAKADDEKGYSDAEVCGTDGLGTCDPAFDLDDEYPHWVQVRTMSADDDDGDPDQVNYLLAPVMDLLDDGKIVTATAVVAWGSLASGGDTPFVFSVCEFVFAGGTFPPQEGPSANVPDGINTIEFHGPQGDQPCPPGIPSGLDLPGGFGRVGEQDSCAAVTVSEDGWVVRNPGNDLWRNCDLSAWQYDGTEDSVIVIALYDTVSRDSGGKGKNAKSIKEYHIAGFVGFKLMGYRMGGNRYWSYNQSVCPIGPANSSYFCGEFTKVSVSRGDLGTGPNYGASVVKLIG